MGLAHARWPRPVEAVLHPSCLKASRAFERATDGDGIEDLALRRHLQTCDRCRREIGRRRAMHRSLRRLVSSAHGPLAGHDHPGWATRPTRTARDDRHLAPRPTTPASPAQQAPAQQAAAQQTPAGLAGGGEHVGELEEFGELGGGGRAWQTKVGAGLAGAAGVAAIGAALVRRASRSWTLGLGSESRK